MTDKGQLVLTPQLQQAIQMLGASWRDLYTLIEEKIEANPLVRWQSPEVDPVADVEIEVHPAGISANVSDCGELYAEPGDDEAMYRDAQWFVRSVERRHETLYCLCDILIAKQESFLRGEKATPERLSIRSIADDLGFHESTVLRVATGKTARVGDREMSLDELLGR